MAEDTINVEGLLFDAPIAGGAKPLGTPHAGGLGRNDSGRPLPPGGSKIAEDPIMFTHPLQKQETVLQKEGTTNAVEVVETMLLPHSIISPEMPGTIVGKSEYSPQLIEEMYSYFYHREKTRTVTENIYMKDGSIREVTKEIANTPPHFSEFCRKRGIHVRIIKLWRKEHPEFEQAYEDCQEIIKEFLIDNGLTGNYSSQFSIYVANNLTDMKDKSEVTKVNVNLNKFLNRLDGTQK